jgi:hypothetical protein
MKNTIITIALVLLSFVSNSQVITIQFDTVQFFSHSSNMSTEQARLTNKIVYGSLGKTYRTRVITFDLVNMIQTMEGFPNYIIKNNDTKNPVDVIVDQSGQIVVCILAKTEEGEMIYIFEREEDDMVKGYFVMNPKIVE